MKISVDVPVEWNTKRKLDGLTWRGIISRGFQMQNLEPKMRLIEDEYKRLQEKQARTAALLQKYSQSGSKNP